MGSNAIHYELRRFDFIGVFFSSMGVQMNGA
jgi:hypothetical protein